MANSKYNVVLLSVAEDLVKLIAGNITSVDISNFKALGARKTWTDTATIIVAGEKVHTVNTVNAHTLAVGDVLGALGHRGNFYISKDLVLTLTKIEEKATKVSLADIIAKAKAPKVEEIAA